jgi:ABC-type antimicrobial peptide transport system permease subunit
MGGIVFDQTILATFAALFLIGLLSGFLPSVQAYRVSLSENLKPKT